MKVQELIDRLSEFDGDKTVCINDSPRYAPAYAYDVKFVRNAELSPYFSDDDETEEVVSIRIGEQIGVVE